MQGLGEVQALKSKPRHFWRLAKARELHSPSQFAVIYIYYNVYIYIYIHTHLVLQLGLK